MDLDLTLGSPGATLSGIAPRLYFGGVRIGTGAAVLTALTAIDYVLSGLPEGGGEVYDLTYEWPAGVWSVYRWDDLKAPSFVIVPFRIAGLSVGDLDLRLFRNGVEATGVSLSARELGAGMEPGDYRVSGWPAPESGERWTLRWSFGGLHGARTWRSQEAAAGDRLDLDQRFYAAFCALWRAATPPAPLAAMPHVAAPGAGYKPANQEPFLEMDLLTDRGEEWGPVEAKNFDLPGLLQLSVQVQAGDGWLLANALIRIAADCLRSLRVQGLKLYGARKPYETHAPMPGYYGRSLDCPLRYVGA